MERSGAFDDGLRGTLRRVLRTPESQEMTFTPRCWGASGGHERVRVGREIAMTFTFCANQRV
jgi:hypothetical protein